MAAGETGTPSERTRPPLGSKAEEVRFAAQCTADEMAPFLHSTSSEVLRALVGNPRFGERETLLLLNRRNLPASVVEELAVLHLVVDSYAVRLSLAKHAKTPLRIALEQLKFLYVFDLVSVCLQTTTPVAVKRASEELVLAQIPKLPIGQRITLARRGSARIAASLLKWENSRIIHAVLENPYLTEAALIPVLNQPECPPKIVEAIATHPKWGLRYDVRLALLRSPNLPLAQSLAILPNLKPQDVQVVAQDKRVIPQVRNYLANRLKGLKSMT